MSFTHYRIGVPKGIRTPVTAVKGQCPRPLDDGDRYVTDLPVIYNLPVLVELSGIEPLTSCVQGRRSPS